MSHWPPRLLPRDLPRVRMAMSRQMDGFGAGVADGLVLRPDNGSNKISEESQSKTACFGIGSAPR